MAGKRKGSRPKGEPAPITHGTWYATDKGWAVRYTRHGKEVRRVFGRLIEKKLGVLPWADAVAIIAQYDAEVDSCIARFDTLTDEQKAEVRSRGGILELSAAASMAPRFAHYFRSQLDNRPLEELAADYRARKASLPHGHMIEPDEDKFDLTKPEGWAYRAYVLTQKAQVAEAVGAHLHPIADKVLAAPAKGNDTLDGLYFVWKEHNKDSAETERKLIAHLAKLKAFLKDGGKDGKGASTFPWRALTAQHARDWKKALVAEYGDTSPSPEKHLGSLKAAFKAAQKEGWIRDRSAESPFHGVSAPHRSANEEEETAIPFNGAQIRTILEKAPIWLAKQGVGNKRAGHKGRPDAADYYQVIRLMTYQGLRPNEACNVLRRDLEIIDGVKCVRIRVTLRGDQPKGKAGMRRVLPLHPAIEDIWDYESNGDKDSPFLFASLVRAKQGNRYAWLGHYACRLLKDECGIFEPMPDDPDENAYKLYSLRHSYHDAMIAAGLPLEMQRVLTGHAKEDSHTRYGRGVELKRLAEAAAKIDPLKLRCD